MSNPDLIDFLERVKEWSSDRQNDVVHMLTGMEASGTTTYRLSAEEKTAVMEGLNSELASDEEVARFRQRHLV